MFFSPFRVPAGMLDTEKSACLELFIRRKRLTLQLRVIRKREIKDRLIQLFESDYRALEDYRKSLAYIFGELPVPAEDIAEICALSGIVEYEPVPLPRELVISPMTRESFANGIALLVADMDRLDHIPI